mmetsp:Transcript_32418/g.94923  ORF Transcript_32418/g.94923 Transcript_32418/m.94923 type:complete len:337 (+) Transcript_32418:76-1086(+)
MGACAGQLSDCHGRKPGNDGEQKAAALASQSRRGNPSWAPMDVVNSDPHAMEQFEGLFSNEEILGVDFAAFYHSYSHAALLYEVRAAAAAILCGYDSCAAPLPRLLAEDFAATPTARALMRKIAEEWGPDKSDHKPAFRRVGISVMCSLLATGPECCLQVAFFQGYSCRQIAFREVLAEELARGLGLSPDAVERCIEHLLDLAARHGLDASILGGRTSPSGRSGHLLQIFVRRDTVDTLCYPALPYGQIDASRLPLSEWLGGDRSFAWGQARILAHPAYFQDPHVVRMFSVSADPAFHSRRAQFQEDLVEALRSAMGPATADPPSAAAAVVSALCP